MHILLVEDEFDARQSLTMLLRSSGYVVTPAASMSQALQELDRIRPDLLISDLSLPDGDGAQVAVKLREVCPGSPAIAITGWGREEQDERHFDHWLSKPVPFNRLLRIVRLSTGRGI